MSTSSDGPTDEPQKGARDGFKLKCTADSCSKTFSGKELSSIFRSAARHWNKEHGSILSKSHRYDTPIDQVEYGGYHIQGNAYEVRKYDIYVTSFDIARELGRIDGFLMAANTACPDCFCQIPDSDERIEDNPHDHFDDDWTCSACREEQKVEQRTRENASLGSWEAQN